MTNQDQIPAFIVRLSRERFYGFVELKFEAGQIVLLRQTETIKLENCRDNRGDHERRKQS